ncbi:hypothetical protein ACFE04_013235 [Oxalis oulophora]
MGVNFSGLFVGPPNANLLVQSKSSLGDLPEGCVALVMEKLDPSDICKLAKLNKAFRGASWADFVWESKLPNNYLFLFNRIFGNNYNYNNDDDDGCLGKLGKREIYTKLCKVNSFDDGTKRAWLDKSTGCVCLSICSKGLAITGIDDRRYWKHIPTEESRFGSIAYLQHVWWFEVDGEVEFPFPPGTYSLFFRLQLGLTAKRFGRRICNTENVHGWDIKPARFQFWTSDGQYGSSQCTLRDPGKWILYHAGDFVVENDNKLTKVCRGYDSIVFDLCMGFVSAALQMLKVQNQLGGLCPLNAIEMARKSKFFTMMATTSFYIMLTLNLDCKRTLLTGVYTIAQLQTSSLGAKNLPEPKQGISFYGIVRDCPHGSLTTMKKMSKMVNDTEQELAYYGGQDATFEVITNLLYGESTSLSR